MPDYTKPPLSEYARPGEVRVSPDALKFARAFHQAVRLSPSAGDPVVVFYWFTRRTSQSRPGAPVEEHGSGLGMGANERGEVPPEVIQTIDGLELAIKLPPEIYEKSRDRVIDVDESAFSKLMLR